MTDDLLARRARVLTGATSAGVEIETCLQHAREPGIAAAFLHLDAAGARAAAAAVDACHVAGAPLPVLGGLAVSVKDLFDVAGQRTTAGSTLRSGVAPATADAPAVGRLRAAGAALIGRTHMTEFAFSGVGLNPHHPTPANVPMSRSADEPPRIPGGSSSGAATSVAGGAAWAALGSDTGGSVRIPAALQGLVGFKNTARLTPAAGAIPLSPTLDTVAAITRSVRDAVCLHEVLADRRVALDGRPLAALRFVVPTTRMLDALEPAVAEAFRRALSALSAGGARIEERALPLLDRLDALQANGGFPAAESWAWHRHHLATHEAAYDRRVVARIRRGAAMSAADYLDLQAARAAWIDAMQAVLRGADALLSPTVPLIAPRVADVEHDDEAFQRVNALLLRNPSVVNVLDGCAVSLPCHAPGEPPVGLMLWTHALRDDALLDAALAVEAGLRPLTGAAA